MIARLLGLKRMTIRKAKNRQSLKKTKNPFLLKKVNLKGNKTSNLLNIPKHRFILNMMMAQGQRRRSNRSMKSYVTVRLVLQKL